MTKRAAPVTELVHQLGGGGHRQELTAGRQNIVMCTQNFTETLRGTYRGSSQQIAESEVVHWVLLIDAGVPRSPLDSKFMESQWSKNILTIVGGEEKGRVDGIKHKLPYLFL